MEIPNLRANNLFLFLPARRNLIFETLLSSGLWEDSFSFNMFVSAPVADLLVISNGKDGMEIRWATPEPPYGAADFLLVFHMWDRMNLCNLFTAYSPLSSFSSLGPFSAKYQIDFDFPSYDFDSSRQMRIAF